MEILEALRTRRSVRRFLDRPVPSESVHAIIQAGIWAPSGLNNQPWRFATVRDAETRGGMAKLTKYGRIIEAAPVLIAVFVDRESMYSEVKDHQAMGACIQNMLLAAHGLGLGAVWLGEILRNADAVRELLGLRDTLDLMAVVALGYPAEGGTKEPQRRGLDEVLLAEL